MSDVKLFKLSEGAAEQLTARTVKLERQLQVLIERHLEAFLRVRFVASEYSTGKSHAGRIDTLGIDENFCPTIIEYKRNSNANVINQGLFYLLKLTDFMPPGLLPPPPRHRPPLRGRGRVPGVARTPRRHPRRP